MKSPASSLRLVRAVRTLFGVLRWLMFIGIALAPLMFVMEPRPGHPAWKGTGNLRFSPDASIQITQQTGGQASGVSLESLRGKLMVTDANASPEFVSFLRWSSFLEILVACGTLAVICHLLWRLCQEIERGEIFTPATLTRVRHVGALMVMGAFVGGMVFTWANHRIGVLVERNFKFTGLTADHFSDFMQYVTFDIVLFTNGLLILTLAEVFRRGLVLQQESELTV